MSLKKLLLVPTNPEYSFDEDPEEQYTYVNPVTLNNLLIKHANAAVEVTEKLIKLRKEQVELVIKHKELKQALEDEEYDILQDAENAPKEHKNLKAQAAYIRKRAKQTGKFEHLAELESQIMKLDIEKMRKLVDIENAASTLETINQLSDNVKTHLSYVKNEMRHTRNFS